MLQIYNDTSRSKHRESIIFAIKIGNKITATTDDVKGNKSTGTQTIKIDTTAPTAGTPTVSSYDTDSITVSATGSDTGGSGIYSYEFQLSTTSSTSGFTTKKTTTSTSSSASYTYEGLTHATTYYMRVVVTDKVGNQTIGAVTTQKTANSAPVKKTTAYCSSSSTSSITIKTAATDADGDTLTYTLEYGTTSSYGSTKTTTGSSRKYGYVYPIRPK